MAQRLLRTSVLGMLTFALLLGGGSAGTDFVHADPSASIVDLPESRSSQPSEKFELRSAIVFASTRDNPAFGDLGKIEIYLMLTKEDGTPDPTQTRRLTTTSAGETFAVLSPDGKKIVFDSNRDRAAGEPGNTSDLFLMNTDGTEQIKLTRGSSATWSPDSKKIAFHASKSGTGLPIRPDPGAPYPDSDIFVLNVDDCLDNLVDCRAKEKAAQPGVLPDFLKNVTNNGAATIDEDADWSPDGQKVAFTRRVSGAPLTTAEIYVIHPDGTGLIQLTNNLEEERAPDWSPNGLRIAYICRTGPPPAGQMTPDFETCVMNADGTGVPQRLTNNDVPDSGHSWSPTGDQIVFSRPAPGSGLPVLRRELFVMNADGTDQKQLTDTPGINIDPSWGRLRVKVGQ